MPTNRNSEEFVDEKALNENEGADEETVGETVSETRTEVNGSTCVNCSCCLDDPSEFLPDTHIVSQQYDDKLREWVGDYKWKLLYRASEHEYLAESFHECCDDKGPTLVIIKSSGGWIFGGYTTQTWKNTVYFNHDHQRATFKVSKDDSKAFIFTLKNPHGVEPTRFMKRKESDDAISNISWNGPAFGTKNGDLFINAFCNTENSCSIHNDGTHAYECHPEYKSSLFVNTAGPDEENKFSLLDYEVFGIEYENRNNINKLCKHPDIIWNYIEMKDISEESLKQVDDDVELLNDLDTIHCDDNILLKMSQLCLKNPSQYLPDTQIVNQQYDSYLQEWLGNDYKWKLIYRASEHEYTSKSFHECCDDKGPTLVIIKSSGGWIFGGYTTQSWSKKNEHKDDDKAFIFTLKNAHGVEPTRYMKREESKYAIGCNPTFGPIFYKDITILYLNKLNSSSVYNDGTRGYECHPEYKSSLFVNTAGPDEQNNFSVLDYEVYTYN